jgi:hypothetical protein
MNFFVMHETFVHTVFDLQTPSLLFMLHEEKDSPYVDSMLGIVSRLLRSILLAKVLLLCKTISAGGISCATACSSMVRQIFSKKQLFLISPRLLADAK